MTKNIFETASRVKLRFNSDMGLLSVEQLWELPLNSPRSNTDIKRIAQGVKRELENTEYDITGTQTVTQSLDNLRLEVLEYIVKVRKEEAEQAEQANIRLNKIAKIDEIIASKQDSELASKPLDELVKLRNTL